MVRQVPSVEAYFPGHEGASLFLPIWLVIAHYGMANGVHSVSVALYLLFQHRRHALVFLKCSLGLGEMQNLALDQSWRGGDIFTGFNVSHRNYMHM
jgi:hypothetical protein